MEPYIPTTPFGRRTPQLAHIAAQAVAKARPADKAAHKWQVFRAICTAKERLGVSERALAVLDALLSFHPETTLCGDGLIVFPSNAQLSLRAHGMAPATLRRHLAALVDAGLVVRRDSPNGKRYARKGQGGQIEKAFGFDLGPLVARAEEFEALAAEVRAGEQALRRARETITLLRRDIAKTIAAGAEANVPAPGPEGWAAPLDLYRSLVARVPRKATLEDLRSVVSELSALAADLIFHLERQIKFKETSANESQSERHIQNSNSQPKSELEPAFDESGAVAAIMAKAPSGGRAETAFPLGMVLQACPDIVDYARGGVGSWGDFLAAAQVVRAALGVSPSAWEAARAAMGEKSAAIVVAAILQRGPAISSAGGYLRDLTRKAEAKAFSIGPMLMALIASRNREKKRA